MNNAIETLGKTRASLLSLTAALSLHDLNTIPGGFSNNIIWNMAHLVASADGICYMRAGLQGQVAEDFAAAYRPGTAPTGPVTAETVNMIKRLMLEMPAKLGADYAAGIFSKITYTPVTTRYGVELRSIEDAIQFVGYHEGMHTGYIMALKRALAKQQQQ